MSPNFYYDQEDFLRQRQTGKSWSFTVLRPEAVSGYAIGNPMNLTMVIGVYAAISKELGLPLRFPGPEGAYRALYQVTSAELLARAAVWAGETPAARNEICNITNGDYFRWQFMWPKIARSFQMEIAEPVPMPLRVYMADKGPLWGAMAKKYRLKPIPYDQIVNWSFGDFIFNSSAFDNISSTIKARQHGFHDCIDTEDMFINFFATRENGISCHHSIRSGGRAKRRYRRCIASAQARSLAKMSSPPGEGKTELGGCFKLAQLVR